MQVSFSTRARMALNILWGRASPIPSSTKQSPFLWPTWREGKPQWNIINWDSYVQEGFSLNSLIYSAIMYKVRSVSIAPLRAYSGETDKPELLPATHPLSKLATRPNPYQSGQEFMNLNTVYLNIAGNSYVMLDRPKPGALPTAMYPLRPDRVMIVPAEHRLKGYLYVPEGKGVLDGLPILPEDMMHVRLPNPADPLEGMGQGLSPFAAMAQSADVDNAVTHYLNLFFKRGAAPNVYLQFSGVIEDEIVPRMRNRFMDTYGGYQNWLGPAIMDQGGEIKTFGQSFKEMGFESIDDRNESRVLGPFGVPGILIGTRLGVNRAINANAKELRQQFWQDTMLPELSWHEMEYQYHLTMPNGEFVAFDTSGVPALSKDKVAAVNAFVELVNVGIPKDIAAAYMDIEFAQDLPDGMVVYMPTSLVPVGGGAGSAGSAGPTTTPAAELAPGTAPAIEAATGLNLNGAQVQAVMNIVESVGAGKISRNVAISMLQTMFGMDATQASSMFEATQEATTKSVHANKAGLTLEQKAAHWKAVDKVATSWENEFSTSAGAALEQDKRNVLAIVSGVKSKALRHKASLEWAGAVDDVAHYLETEGADQWREKFTPLLKGVMTEQGRRWAGELGLRFNVRNFFAEDWFNTYTLKFAQPINDTTLETLSTVLEQAQREGWSVAETQKHVTTLFDQWMQGGASPEDFAWYAERMPAYRTEMIARTETMRASNAGSQMLFSDWGVKQHEWLSTLDDRVRETHADVNGQVQPIDEPFEVGGESLMYPGDPAGSAGNTINCRCTVLPVME